VEVFEDNIWIATGGAHARVLHSPDKGRTWSFQETALEQGKPLTGIFSIDFDDAGYGIIAGGNYEEPLPAERTIAITRDAGNSWEAPAHGNIPSFGSCVQFRPGSNGQTILVAGVSGIYISSNGGYSWDEMRDGVGKALDDRYYTIRFSPSGRVAWIAGADGHIAKIMFR